MDTIIEEYVMYKRDELVKYAAANKDMRYNNERVD